MKLLRGRAEIDRHRVKITAAGARIGARGVGEKVVYGGAPAALAGEQIAAAAERRQHRLGHAGGEKTADGGVESVAAGAQNVGRDARGQMVSGGNGSFHINGLRRFCGKKRN